jgi:adenylosuccinate synthase
MKLDVLLGLQWGDEGKGKIVDVLCPKYNIIARFQGGPNAGHTLKINNKQTILHSIPSGIFHPGVVNIIGNGVVLDPVIFSQEIDTIEEQGVDIRAILKISKKAHLILPTHRLLDKASEDAKGKSKIGSTLKGIGPTYMDKTGRNGLRVGDILSPDFIKKYNALKEKHFNILSQYATKYEDAAYESKWFEGIERIKSFELINNESFIHDQLKQEKRILAEGAQGTMLDIDFGSYPFVTSSNTVCAGACTGLGVAPVQIGEVIGIVKAYCTRVGSGPFPTELNDGIGEKLREIGREFGATTGRARRCGWLDLVALKYSVMINGVSQIILTKIDVLSEFEKIKICTSYRLNDGSVTSEFPYSLDEIAEPVYEELNGWSTDVTTITKETDLPVELLEYVSFIERYLEVPVKVISVGPGREATIIR